MEAIRFKHQNAAKPEAMTALESAKSHAAEDSKVSVAPDETAI